MIVGYVCRSFKAGFITEDVDSQKVSEILCLLTVLRSRCLTTPGFLT